MMAILGVNLTRKENGDMWVFNVQKVLQSTTSCSLSFHH